MGQNQHFWKTNVKHLIVLKKTTTFLINSEIFPKTTGYNRAESIIFGNKSDIFLLF